MGLLDDLKKKVGQSAESLNTRVGEMTAKISTNFASSFPFLKLSNGKDTIKAATSRAIDATGVGALTAEQRLRVLDEVSRLEAADRFTFNELTTDEATKLFQSSIESSVTASSVKAEQRPRDPSDHQVKLVELSPDARQIRSVVFKVMPEVYESRTVEYEAVAPPQNPGAFQKYKGTGSTQWTVNATLICRTIPEATENLRMLNTLRAWTMPFFGARTQVTNPLKTGAPPPVLQFSGWRTGMISPIPTVITSLTWTFPQDVDYIPANALDGSGQLIPFPTVLRVAIQLVESFSAEQFNGFDLQHMHTGDWENAWKPLVRGGQLDAITSSGEFFGPPEEAQEILQFPTTPPRLGVGNLDGLPNVLSAEENVNELARLANRFPKPSTPTPVFDSRIVGNPFVGEENSLGGP